MCELFSLQKSLQKYFVLKMFLKMFIFHFAWVFCVELRVRSFQIRAKWNLWCTTKLKILFIYTEIRLRDVNHVPVFTYYSATSSTDLRFYNIHTDEFNIKSISQCRIQHWIISFLFFRGMKSRWSALVEWHLNVIYCCFIFDIWIV